MIYKCHYFTILLATVCFFTSCGSDSREGMDEYPLELNYDGFRQLEERLFVVDDNKQLNEISISGRFAAYSTQLEEQELQMDPFFMNDPGIKITLLSDSELKFTYLNDLGEVILDIVLEYYLEGEKLIVPAIDPDSGFTFDREKRELVTYYSYQGLFPGPNAEQDSFFYHDIIYFDTDTFTIWYDYEDPDYVVEQSFPLDTYYMVSYHLIHK